MPVEVARAMLKDQKEEQEEKSFENLPSLMVPETGVGEADNVTVDAEREGDGEEPAAPRAKEREDSSPDMLEGESMKTEDPFF